MSDFLLSYIHFQSQGYNCIHWTTCLPAQLSADTYAISSLVSCTGWLLLREKLQLFLQFFSASSSSSLSTLSSQDKDRLQP